MTTLPTSDNKRRTIQARDTKWANRLARQIAQTGVSPNMISVFSTVFAFLAGVSFLWTAKESNGNPWVHFLAGALLIQFRLLCNLFDGMVAIEFNKKSKSGEIFNDFPDRPADIFIIVGAGYAVSMMPFGIELGWLAAVLAVLTAYVRVLGVSAGAKTYFIGPMAKQHRMAILTLGSLASIAEVQVYGSRWILWFALLIVATGSLITVARRLKLIIRDLEARS